ncbi:DHA2 family efflux MFS transporter permease subunit [Thermodesulfovibrio sp.]|uniref:DHA2 family efflux MFS transporter permease subunit n=1 Tax=Thermodesulfovibrio TaxID=28261 RepID=UPI002606D77D|nr:DHA2 family efflux MFS transporter permease subunit [Thermodesulfovibrio sp.]
MKRFWIVLTVMLPTFIEILDTTINNVALRHIQGDMSAGIDESTWIITSYLVANAVVIPMAGWLSRVFGRKNYLIFSISLFTFASLLCGISWDLNTLIFFRILQGIGGGGLQPLSQSILLESFPKHQYGKAMAIYGMGIILAPIFGPMIGGWISDNFSWRWIYYINIPIGIISILMTYLVIEDPPYLKRERLKIDYPGIIFLSLGIGCLQVVLDKGEREDWFDSNLIVTLSIISLISLIVLVWWELKRAEHPVVNLRLFKDKNFLFGNLVMFFTFINLFGSIILLPIYLQNLMGYTAYLAGLVLGPAGIVQLIAFPISGKISDRINPKIPLAFGIVMCAYSTYLMSLFNLQADFWSFVYPRAVLALGMAFVITPLAVMTVAFVPKEKMQDATPLSAVIRNIGGSVGTAVVTTIVSQRAQFHQYRLIENLTPYDLPYQNMIEKLSEYLSTRSLLSPEAALYRELVRQANSIAFNEAFWILSVAMFSMLLTIFFFKRPIYKKGGIKDAIH